MQHRKDDPVDEQMPFAAPRPQGHGTGSTAPLECASPGPAERPATVGTTSDQTLTAQVDRLFALLASGEHTPEQECLRGPLLDNTKAQALVLNRLALILDLLRSWRDVQQDSIFAQCTPDGRTRRVLPYLGYRPGASC